MTSKGIFNEYFKRKLIIWMGVGITATLIRLLRGYETTFTFAVTINLFFMAAALIVGYIDYNFYEKSTPKKIARLIDKDPLLGFRNIGFARQGDNRLEGQINNYKIIFSPLINIRNENFLTILIPLRMREGLGSYFVKYSDNFKFNLSDGILFAEAIIKDYDKRYTYNQLFDLIDRTTVSLTENRIESLNIVEAKYSDSGD